jgi:hypothetical protein
LSDGADTLGVALLPYSLAGLLAHETFLQVETVKSYLEGIDEA